MASILIIEDSLDSAALIEVALSGNDLEIARTLGDARACLALPPAYDLIILDLDLPDGDGLSIASEISAGERPPIPFIILSSRSDVRNKLVAFSLGAEDYVEKPFHSLELRARVSARLRARPPTSASCVQATLGRLRVETENMRAFLVQDESERELDLSTTEHRILEILIERPGQVRSREQLISQIWRDAIVGHRTIDSHVSNLRKKLRETETEIESVRGVGYRMGVRANGPAG